MSNPKFMSTICDECSKPFDHPYEDIYNWFCPDCTRLGSKIKRIDDALLMQERRMNDSMWLSDPSMDNDYD